MAERRRYAVGQELVIVSGTRPVGWSGSATTRAEHHYLKVGTLVEVIQCFIDGGAYRVQPVSDSDDVWTRRSSMRDQHVFEDQVFPAFTSTTLAEIEEFLHADTP